MHNIILGKRNTAAQQAIMQYAEALAVHFDIAPVFVSALKVQEKDVAVRAMKQREAVAALLGQISQTLGLIPGTVEETVEPADQAEETEADEDGDVTPVTGGASAEDVPPLDLGAETPAG